MDDSDIEEAVHCIIKEISAVCQEDDQHIPDTVIAFMIRAILLHPDHSDLLGQLCEQTVVDKLVSLCCLKFSSHSSSALAAIKMQVYMETNYTPREEVIRGQRIVLENRLTPITEDIMATKTNTKEDLDFLYRQLVNYTILRSALGDTADPAVVKEATAAMQSVFPPTELGNLMSMNQREKEQQLRELAGITAGIRIYNWDCGRGGQGVKDVALLAAQISAELKNDLETELGRTLHLAYNCTTIMEKHEDGKRGLEGDGEGGSMEEVKEMMVLSRQYEVYIRRLLGDLLESSELVDMLSETRGKALDELKAHIESRPSVATSNVLPVFLEVADIWRAMEDEMVVVGVLQEVLEGLKWYSKVYRGDEVVLSANQIDRLLDGEVIVTDTERREKNQERVEEGQLPETIILPNMVKNFDRIPLKYGGFCGPTLVDRGGLLLPADPGLGVLYHQGSFFAFSSALAAEVFASEPESYCQRVRDYVSRHPELIHLLNMEDNFSTPEATPGEQLPPPVLLADKEVQTELHPIPSYIDPNYCWNEWALRRRAVQLADLTGRRTHNSQTRESHLKATQATQVYEPREESTQTLVETGTSVPRPQTYFYGLRGQKGQEGARVIDVTAKKD